MAPKTVPLHRTALVVRRPLPYLYLAREVFGSAGVPFETLDTLPLAAEPYAAALDVALEAVAADFSRASLMALLRSPHFRIAERTELTGRVLAAFDVALADARYLGGLDRLQQLADEWEAIGVPSSRIERRYKAAAPAARAALEAVRVLAPLAFTGAVGRHIEMLVGLAQAVRSRAARRCVDGAALVARARGGARRARVARGGVPAHDPGASGDVTTMSAAIRRWLGSQTFAVSSGDQDCRSSMRRRRASAILTTCSSSA